LANLPFCSPIPPPATSSASLPSALFTPSQLGIGTPQIPNNPLSNFGAQNDTVRIFIGNCMDEKLIL
jgi:hypothetical protein